MISTFIEFICQFLLISTFTGCVFAIISGYVVFKRRQNKFSQLCSEMQELIKDPLSDKSKVLKVNEVLNSFMGHIEILHEFRPGNQSPHYDQVSLSLTQLLRKHSIAICGTTVVICIAGIIYATKACLDLRRQLKETQPGGEFYGEFVEKIQKPLNNLWQNGKKIGLNPTYCEVETWCIQSKEIFINVRSFREKLAEKHAQKLKMQKILTIAGYTGAVFGVGGLLASYFIEEFKYLAISAAAGILAGFCYIGSKEAGKLLAELENLDSKIISLMTLWNVEAK